MAAPATPTLARHADTSTPSRPFVGEVVYLYAFDIAYELDRGPVTELLGQKLMPLELDVSRRNPRHHSFFRPRMIRLPPVERHGPGGPLRLERTVKLLPAGAISLSVRVPFAVQSLDELVAWHDLRFTTGSLHEEMRQLAESVRAELAPYCTRPWPRLLDEEAYTVFCLEAPLVDPQGRIIPGEDWLQARRRSVAALLMEEPDESDLAAQETEESTHRYLSYYQNDLVVVDWDAALIVDERADWEESLYVMELANLQLSELEAYDRLLNDCLERAYRDLVQRASWRRRRVLHELREMRIDMARFSDELMNITKFFGDWHLARLYENVAARFHLGDWHRTIDEKLKTLDGLYEILKHDQNNRWMLILEVTIVLLFLIDLFILFGGFKAG